MKWKEGIKTAGKVGKAILDGLGEGFEKACRIREEARRYAQTSTFIDDNTIVLNGNAMTQMRWMTTNQIRTIIGNKKVKLANDPKVWDCMRWMTTSQLEAIFGKDIPGRT